MTFTPDQLNTLIQSALYTKPFPFLGDYEEKGDVLATWPLINPRIIAAGIPQQAFNLDCMKVCTANDGKVYEQPHFAFNEKTSAAYLQINFDQKLPVWDMVLNGNFGTRYVKTDVVATGFMTLAHVAVNPGYDFVTNTGTTTTTSVAVNTSVQDSTEDWLPSLNINLWVIPDKVVTRFYSAKVMSRPAAGALLPSGTCTIDERNLAEINDQLSDDNANTCSGRVGNPALKPYKAINKNWSLEWYVNRDITLSTNYFYNRIIVGRPINANLPASNLFAGSDAKDPVTGDSFSDYDFTYPSYVNGPGGIQLGYEYSAKVALTMLPWLLKHTGFDANYTKLGYKNFATSQDLITGDFNPPEGQREWTRNFSLWYDDGRLNMRASYQAQSGFFAFISSCSNALNNFPTSFAQCPGQTIRTPYNPGGTNYRAGTEFIDAKINYKVKKNIDIFFQGRNITRKATSYTYQPNNTYSDGAPTLQGFSYSGARYQVGFTYRN